MTFINKLAWGICLCLVSPLLFFVHPFLLIFSLLGLFAGTISLWQAWEDYLCLRAGKIVEYTEDDVLAALSFTEWRSVILIKREMMLQKGVANSRLFNHEPPLHLFNSTLYKLVMEGFAEKRDLPCPKMESGFRHEYRRAEGGQRFQNKSEQKSNLAAGQLSPQPT